MNNVFLGRYYGLYGIKRKLSEGNDREYKFLKFLKGLIKL